MSSGRCENDRYLVEMCKVDGRMFLECFWCLLQKKRRLEYFQHHTSIGPGPPASCVPWEIVLTTRRLCYEHFVVGMLLVKYQVHGLKRQLGV